MWLSDAYAVEGQCSEILEDCLKSRTGDDKNTIGRSFNRLRLPDFVLLGVGALKSQDSEAVFGLPCLYATLLGLLASVWKTAYVPIRQIILFYKAGALALGLWAYRHEARRDAWFLVCICKPGIIRRELYFPLGRCKGKVGNLLGLCTIVKL